MIIFLLTGTQVIRLARLNHVVDTIAAQRAMVARSPMSDRVAAEPFIGFGERADGRV